MRVKLPSLLSPFVSKNGTLVPPWNFFLQALTAAPAAFVGIGATVSPQSYTAPNDGSLAIVGGTVSAIQINRAGGLLDTGQTSGLISLSQNDTAIITYSVAPTLTFIPE